MPMDRSLYPKDWEEIAERIKHEADWVCQVCGRVCKRPGQTLKDFTHEPKPVQFVLTVAHLDHQPGNCDPSNLVAMCSVCHLRYDSKRKQSMAKKKAKKKEVKKAKKKASSKKPAAKASKKKPGGGGLSAPEERMLSTVKRRKSGWLMEDLIEDMGIQYAAVRRSLVGLLEKGKVAREAVATESGKGFRYLWFAK